MAILEERTIPSPVSRVIGDLDFVFRIFVTRKDDPVVKRRESSRRKAEGPLQVCLSNIRFWVRLWLASFHSAPLVGDIHRNPSEGIQGKQMTREKGIRGRYMHRGSMRRIKSECSLSKAPS